MKVIYEGKPVAVFPKRMSLILMDEDDNININEVELDKPIFIVLVWSDNEIAALNPEAGTNIRKIEIEEVLNNTEYEVHLHL